MVIGYRHSASQWWVYMYGVAITAVQSILSGAQLISYSHCVQSIVLADLRHDRVKLEQSKSTLWEMRDTWTTGQGEKRKRSSRNLGHWYFDLIRYLLLSEVNLTAD